MVTWLNKEGHQQTLLIWGRNISKIIKGFLEESEYYNLITLVKAT